MKPSVREVIVVEGRYDKNTVLQAVDALVIETRGFGVMRDNELMALLRTLSATRGVVILTDGDGAGFVIRGKLKSALPREGVKHAFIPDIEGKERRKSARSREGKLGVEGMPPDVIIDALRRAGATVSGEAAVTQSPFAPSLLFELGLSGGADSAARRDALKQRLGLPARLSAKALFDILPALVSEDELRDLVNG